tara:strand:- start:3606 stop:5006 length:1401 start_codon:yes stop_codon:yes gene_type:complete
MHKRRDFLKTFMSLAAVSAGGSALQCLPVSPAAAATVDDYRALVCVFLFGGMDCHDTVLPHDDASYASYAQLRSSLLDGYTSQPGGSSRALQNLLALAPAGADFGGRQFALPPQLGGLHTLFNAGQAAIVGNVGPLVEPTDRDAFLAGTARVPARLFSHNDQQSTWMSFAPEGAQLGWGGRFGDAAVQSGANVESIFSQISLAGNSVFLTGDLVSPYQISASGVPSIALIEAAQRRSGAAVGGIMRDHFASANATFDNLFARDFVNLSRVSLDANDTLERALREGGSGLAAAFPASALGAQLQAVAQTIAVREVLGARRQVFFVALGGFDTHATQAADLPALQQDLGDSIAAFYAATQELGVADSVTTFTAADFGRTLTVNGDGTDHGWGGHQFVVGGAVNGGEIYGDIPPPLLEHAQDAGNGRLIPTTSVEQFAAPLGRWFGLSEPELTAALPGLGAFPPAPAFI